MSPSSRFCWVGVLVNLAVTGGFASTQRATIPDLVSRGAVSAAATVPSGQMPTVAELLEQTDILVQGTLGNPRSYLSNDETEVFTDYSLTGQTILFSAKQALSLPPVLARSITVTQKGGTVVVNGVSFTQKEPALEPLQPGTEVLCLLQSTGSKNMIAGSFFGVFSIEGGRLNPLMTREDFAREYRGIESRAAIDSMLSLLRARRRML